MNNSKYLGYLFLITIFILSVIKVNTSNLPEESDKVVHFFLYILSAFSFYLIKCKHFVVSAIIYGILIEIIQYFIPWRSFSVGDILSNSAGALTFYIIFKYYKNNKSSL